MNAVAEALDYRDMESELHDAVNMSEMTCHLIEGAGVKREGGILLTEEEWGLIAFAVCHTNRLAIDLKQRWDEIHDSNVAAKGGAR